MRTLRRWMVRLGGLFAPERGDRDFDAELDAHLQMHIDDNLRRGMAPEAARHAALARLGGVQALKELHREGRRFRPLTELAQDLRYAARMFRRSPGFTLVALVTIALGIFGPTVTFTMMKAWILDPLPFDRPDDLVDIRRLDRPSGDVGSLNPADFLEWQRTSRTFEGLAAYRQSEVRLTGHDRAERLRAAVVTPEFFRLLRVRAAIGRVFDDNDRNGDASRLVVISHAMWREQLRADAAAVGRSVRINGEDHTVIGVLPEQFQFTLMGRVDVWRPLLFTAQDADNRRPLSVRAFGRLRPSRTVADARLELESAAAQLAAKYPDTNARRSVRVWRLADEIRVHHDLGFIVPVMFAMVGCVLLIACVNVTNVMLARVSTRRQEMAVRLALGASRGRIIRQWLVEHVLLFTVASAGGAALAVYGANWITNSIPIDNRQYLRNYAVLPVDRTVVLFALAIGVLCGVIFGWLPGWTGAKSDVNRDLRDSTARGTGSARGGRLRSALVMSEVALALAILISAGLVVQSTRNMRHVDVGFDPGHLLTFQLSLDAQRYRTPAEIQMFYERLTADLGKQPGIIAAAAGSLVPFGTYGNATEIFFEGKPEPAPADTPWVALAEVTASYAETMQLRPVRGRMLGAADTADAPKAAVINETLAVRHFPNQDPIGRRIRLARDSSTVWTIVGTVADVKNVETVDPPSPQVYLASAQQPRRSMTVVVRSSQEPPAMASIVRGAVATLDPAEPIGDLVTMEERIHRVTGPFETMSTFVRFLAGVTLLLAGIGVYGVVSYAFAQRTKEIGIRIALGARRADVAGLVLKQIRRLLIVALVPGIVLAWGLGQSLKAMLFGVTPTDWRLYVSMTFVLAAVAVLAAFVPARRATAIDPVAALRHE